MMDVLRTWFAGLRPREQWSVVTLALALALYLPYRGLWVPLARDHAAVSQQNAVLAQSLLRVDALAAQLRARRAQETRIPTQRNLNALVNQSTLQFGLQVARLQPNSRGEIEVRLDNAPLPALLRWLHHLEQEQALPLIELALSQTVQDGRVNATIRIGPAA